MSPLAAPLATFLFFSGFAAAQVYAPDCSLTWKWTFNSLGQNACTIAAYMLSTCNGGSFTIDALVPGYSYLGPSGTAIDDANMCKCNTVTYSLISACDACQGADWISWAEYSFNCTKTLPASSFPNPIPSGTRVPQWALIDITSEGNWNSNQSFAVGDTPEQAPGVLLGASGATVSATGGATSSLFGETSSAVNPTSGTSSSSSPTSKSSSNTGAIVGGVVGAVAVISLAAIAIFFFRRQRRPEAPAPVAPSVFGASQPPMDEVQQPLTMDDRYTTSSFPGTIGSSIPGTPGATMRIYDPNDPSTFPGYQGIPQTPASPQGTVPSFNGYQGVPETPTSPPLGIVPSFNGTNGTGNSLATMQTSRPQGYHGLPTV